MKISVGPIYYYWPRQQVMDFYQEIIQTPVDVIYLGETVCAKRRELRSGDWLELAEELCDSGKKIVLSTLTLIESRADIAALKKLCSQSPCLVEANDMSAVQILADNNLPFVAGPSINIYNAQALQVLYQKGMQRWVMPVEIMRQNLDGILKQAMTMGFGDMIETEVFSYGKLPLAYSARCFTARAKNLAKDGCQLSCIDYPDGLPLHSQEFQVHGETPKLFTINGIQTQSGKCYNLLDQWPVMHKIGVDIMRVSPGSQGTADVIRQLSSALSGASADLSRTQVNGQLKLISEEQCNGYWYGVPGMDSCAGLAGDK
ncbi:putative protease [Gammaproteobacteria bacterium MOLA455]|nr:putative protease [Gammaproteobacteria bacterium MOLA455]